jgi:hypothetical protein
MTFIKKQQNGIWEKPSENQGKKIKLNLGELIMIRRVLSGLDDKWSTIHTFKEEKTQISVSRNKNNQEQIWINADSYSKNIKLPETEIFQLLLNHIIDEKIIYSTCNKGSRTNFQKSPVNNDNIEESLVNGKSKQITELPVKNNNQNGDFSEMQAIYVRETEKAVCVQFDGEEKESWVPKSILNNLIINSDEYQTLLLPKWFIEKRK